MNEITNFIEDKLKEKNMKKSELLKIINSDFKAGYKYLNGERKVKRDMLIKMCIAFDMSLKEVEDLFLKNYYAQFYLEATRDAIIVDGIKNKLTIQEINSNLKEKKCALL